MSNNTREGRKPPQKTQSYKKDRKKTDNWFQRQFSIQMSDINDASNIEFATAVAAVAYAITLLEKEEDSLNQNKTTEELTHPPAKIKSIREDSMNEPTDYSRLTRWLTGKESKEDERQSGDSSLKRTGTLEGKMLGEFDADRTQSRKAKETNLTIKKATTFSDKYLNDTGSSWSERGQKPQNQTGQQTPSMIKPTESFSGKGNRGGRITGSPKVETEVDAWERAKIDKIRRRYEKTMSTIQEWENEKRLKAKRQLERKEKNLEYRGAKALHKHHNEISSIDKISGGARALAEERKRNDELNTVEKAKKMRSAGKVP